MGEFFKRWRRKVGVVTLLMALALMAGYSHYLMESFCRQGIGAALFQKVIELLRSVHPTAMKVWVLSDHPYRPFYVRQGGNIIEEKIITIGETDLIELAYGWQTLEASGNIYHA